MCKKERVVAYLLCCSHFKVTCEESHLHNETEGGSPFCQSQPVTKGCNLEDYEAVTPCVGLNSHRFNLFPPKLSYHTVTIKMQNNGP